jgi:uncharacterized membrane protein YfcA
MRHGRVLVVAGLAVVVAAAVGAVAGVAGAAVDPRTMLGLAVGGMLLMAVGQDRTGEDPPADRELRG